MIRATWALSLNVGDALTPWLIRKLSGAEPVFTPADRPGEKYILTGSILNWADDETRVWGAGVAWMADKVNPGATIHAVRGPLSRAAALAHGAACPPVLGDPALVLPLLYSPRTSSTGVVGIIPHYVDQERAEDVFGDAPGIRIIDVLAPVEEFIDAVCSCDCIASSSLHGLLFAAAYELPVAWLVFTDEVIGDGTKFRDGLWPLGIDVDRPLDLRTVTTDERPSADNLRAIMQGGRRYDPRPLLDAYPLPRVA